MKRLSPFVLPLLFTLAGPAHAQDVAPRIDAIVDAGPLGRAHWGVHVIDAASGVEVYARNEDRLFVPASVLKLVVAAAGAHYLGGDYAWQTRVHAAGPIVNGELRGDLVLHGSGDPAISGRFTNGMLDILQMWADSLAAHGVRRIGGTIVADQTLWDDQLRSHDWELYDANWWYAAPVAPLGFNDNAIDFRVAAGDVGAPARITWEPEHAGVVFLNRTRTVAAGEPYTLDFDRLPGTDTIFAYGQIPADARVQTEYFAVRDPGVYLATVLRGVLEARGIDVADDAVRAVYAPAASPSADGAHVFTWSSPPLPRAMSPILLTSQNWFAEQLSKTIGLEVKGEGSWEAGLTAAGEFLSNAVGIDSTAYELRDASGLSSSNLITPRALTTLLRHVHGGALHTLLETGISVSGESGSLRNRFTDLPGRVAAKTGSIRHVSSLAGTVRTDSGRTLVFAIIANNTGVSGSVVSRAIDDVVRALAAL